VAAGTAGVALTVAGLFDALPARAALLDELSATTLPAQVQPTPAVDVTELQAQREALMARRSVAVEVRIGTLNAIEQQRIAALGYDPETATTPREIARQMMANKYGWGEEQFGCYDAIIMRESRWNPYADNPTSSAYGIPQALPGRKMASAGADWRTNPATQIKWGLGYVKQRYGTPCSAWGFKRSHGWY
jgi:hypothetical protein